MRGEYATQPSSQASWASSYRSSSGRSVSLSSDVDAPNQRLIELLGRDELPRVPCLLALFLAHVIARHVVDARRQHHTEHHAPHAKESCHDNIVHARIIAPPPFGALDKRCQIGVTILS